MYTLTTYSIEAILYSQFDRIGDDIFVIVTTFSNKRCRPYD